jgi:hypothetical protein
MTCARFAGLREERTESASRRASAMRVPARMLKELSMTRSRSFSLLRFAAVRLMNGFAKARISRISRSVRSENRRR